MHRQMSTEDLTDSLGRYPDSVYREQGEERPGRKRKHELQELPWRSSYTTGMHCLRWVCRRQNALAPATLLQQTRTCLVLTTDPHIPEQ